MNRCGGVVVLVVASALVCGSAHATLIATKWTGSQGSLAAMAMFAEFTENGNSFLNVTLYNTSQVAAQRPSDVLSAMFFDISSHPGSDGKWGTTDDEIWTGSLTRESAALGSGSALVGPNPNNWTVAQGWAYKNTTAEIFPPPTNRTHQGLSSSGLGLFGKGDLFDTSGKKANNPPPDGINHGILPIANAAAPSWNDNLLPLVGRGSDLVGSDGPSVQFTLGGWTPGYQITQVWFQYGTGLNEPGYDGASPSFPGEGTPAVPEPASCALLALAVGGIAAALKRRRR